MDGAGGLAQKSLPRWNAQLPPSPNGACGTECTQIRIVRDGMKMNNSDRWNRDAVCDLSSHKGFCTALLTAHQCASTPKAQPPAMGKPPFVGIKAN